MKNKLIYILALVLCFSSLVSCEDELEEKYYNPERSTDPSIPGFFTAMQNNDRVRPSYWNVRTFLLPQPAVYSQTAFFFNGTTRYQQSDSYVEEYWRNFYVTSANGGGVLGTYRAMEVVQNGLSKEEQQNNQIFIEAGKVVLVEQAAKLVDMWGDIPYSEAGSLPGSNIIANGKFDDQQELYNSFITDLETAATYFSDASSTAAFAKYDITLSGNVEQWERYANSLKMRLLMRMSSVNQEMAQAKITQMLADPGAYPLIDGSDDANYDPATNDVLLQPLTTYIDNLNNALIELPSHYAPDFMLNELLVPSNDPRTEVLFDKFGRTVDNEFVPNEEFRAMPITFTSTQQENEFANYAIIDSTTFLQNPALPGTLMTASEVNFLKAEAYERWGGGDAQMAYETAIKQSISYYYYLNNLNTTGLPTVVKPNDSIMNAFIENDRIAYTGGQEEKLARIYEQKWLHYGFLQSIEAWSSYRRTGYPELTFPEATLSGFSTPPTRLLYPNQEVSLNNNNYQEVAGEDTRTTQVFWDVD